MKIVVIDKMQRMKCIIKQRSVEILGKIINKKTLIL